MTSVMCDTAPMTNSFRLPDQPELLPLPYRTTGLRPECDRFTLRDALTDNVPFCVETVAESKTVVRFDAVSVAREQAGVQFPRCMLDTDTP